MSPDAPFHNLFKNSGVTDKINDFKSLLDSGDLTSEEALARLASIHTDLMTPQPAELHLYQRYAQLLENLRTELPQVHQAVLTILEGPKDQVGKEIDSGSDEMEPKVESESQPVVQNSPMAEPLASHAGGEKTEIAEPGEGAERREDETEKGETGPGGQTAREASSDEPEDSEESRQEPGAEDTNGRAETDEEQTSSEETGEGEQESQKSSDGEGDADGEQAELEAEVAETEGQAESAEEPGEDELEEETESGARDAPDQETETADAGEKSGETGDEPAERGEENSEGAEPFIGLEDGIGNESGEEYLEGSAGGEAAGNG